MDKETIARELFDVGKAFVAEEFPDQVTEETFDDQKDDDVRRLWLHLSEHVLKMILLEKFRTKIWALHYAKHHTLMRNHGLVDAEISQAEKVYGELNG